MNINIELENKLWSVSSENHLNKETYDRIIDYLLARLSDYLQTPLQLVGHNRIHETAFSTTFRGSISPKEVFHISFVGTLGMQVIDDEYGISTSADLYLFSDGHRLTAGQKDRSYIYLEYIRDNNSYGNWVSHGWEIDEFGEYEDIVEDEYYYRKEDS